MYKLDLHTHSQASPDGALGTDHYRRMLAAGALDYIAVTDHDTIEFARELHAELGDRIIVGEEITAREGEIIGLYLKEIIPPHLSAAETARRIHEQGGLVYIPHPFETVRKGLQAMVLDGLSGQIDIIESHNGRSLQNRSAEAIAWAEAHHTAQAASSDAHGWYGWGRTYTVVEEKPARETLVQLLGTARYQVGSPGLRGRLYPKANRLKRRLRRRA